jgi:cell division protein FtsL
MATLATFLKRGTAVAIAAERRETVRAQADPFRLRALPNDHIYFYAKKIDNSRIIRQADPSSRGECWSAVGAAAVLLVLGASIVAPQVGSRLAGYKLEALKQERQSLLNEKRDLDVKEAGLLSPERLNDLARARNLTTPVPGQVIHLDTPPVDASFASNQNPSAAPALVKPAPVSQ